MATQRHHTRCSKCGALLAHAALEEFCPACLYGQAEAESSADVIAKPEDIFEPELIRPDEMAFRTRRGLRP